MKKYQIHLDDRVRKSLSLPDYLWDRLSAYSLEKYKRQNNSIYLRALVREELGVPTVTSAEWVRFHEHVRRKYLCNVVTFYRQHLAKKFKD